MSVILLRHTRLAAVAGLCYGRTDVALAASFEAELAVIRAGLAGVRFGAIWSSPASRCRRLAEAFANPGPIRIETRLQELDFGLWENREWADFRGPESEAWALDPWRLAPPAGESGAALWARVGAFRDELTAANNAGGGAILVVTHAGVIRAWLGLERGLGWAEAMSLPVPHGSLTVIGPCGPKTTVDKF
jgi:alpha-ribazole phosphatase